MKTRKRKIYDALISSGTISKDETPFETHFGETSGLLENDFMTSKTIIELDGSKRTVFVNAASPINGKVCVLYREIES